MPVDASAAGPVKSICYITTSVALFIKWTHCRRLREWVLTSKVLAVRVLDYDASLGYTSLNIAISQSLPLRLYAGDGSDVGIT
jgi:hypothetical protein